jgi:hypothetical protein
LNIGERTIALSVGAALWRTSLHSLKTSCVFFFNYIHIFIIFGFLRASPQFSAGRKLPLAAS